MAEKQGSTASRANGMTKKEAVRQALQAPGRATTLRAPSPRRPRLPPSGAFFPGLPPGVQPGPGPVTDEVEPQPPALRGALPEPLDQRVADGREPVRGEARREFLEAGGDP